MHLVTSGQLQSSDKIKIKSTILWEIYLEWKQITVIRACPAIPVDLTGDSS